MAKVNTEKTFDAEAIRDTSVHNGAGFYLYDFQLKTIIYHNHLDQQVTLQVQASATGSSDWFNVGNSFNVSSSSDGYQTIDAYFPYIRVTAQCGTAPTSGDLTVYLIQYGE
jgi:hypothetical protein